MSSSWMDGSWNLGNFRFSKNVRVPFFKIPQNVGFETSYICPDPIFQIAAKIMVLKIPELSGSHCSNSRNKKWVLKNPTFPDAGAAGAGRTLESRSRPLPAHPGMKYFRKGNPRCWLNMQNLNQNFVFFGPGIHGPKLSKQKQEGVFSY